MTVGGISPSGGSYEPLESAKAVSRKGSSGNIPSASIVRNQIDEALETVKDHPPNSTFTKADKDAIINNLEELKGRLLLLKGSHEDLPPSGKIGSTSGSIVPEASTGTHQEVTMVVNAYNKLVEQYNTVANPPSPLPQF